MLAVFNQPNIVKFMKKISISLVISCLLSSSAFATTLSEALINTYHNNPDLMAAREELKITDELMYKAISGFLPTIQFSANKNHSRQDAVPKNFLQDAQKVSPWIHTKTQGTSLDLKQNLFNGGKTILAIQMAKYTIEAARAKLLSKEQDILISSIQAYLNVVKAQNALEINKENASGAEKRYHAVKERFDAGLVKNADLALTEANKETAYANLAAAEGGYSTALAQYTQIIGLNPDNLSLGANLSPAPITQIDLLNKALKSNPNIIQAEFSKKSADIAVKSNVASMLPTINLTGSMSKTYTKPNTTAYDPYTNSKSIGVELIVPIYQKGLEYSSIRESSADAARLKYVVKNSKNSITQAATQYWNEYSVAQASVKAYENAVKASSIALEGKQQEYSEGSVTILELIESQGHLFNAKIQLNESKQNLELSRYKIASLEGLLNAKDLGLETKIYNPSANYDKVKDKIIGF